MNKKIYTQRFRSQWLNDIRFKKWLRKHPHDDTLAVCVCCDCSIKAKLSEFDQHQNTAKHLKAEEYFDSVEGSEYEDCKPLKYDVEICNPSETTHDLTVEPLVSKLSATPKNAEAFAQGSKTQENNYTLDVSQHFCEAVNLSTTPISSNCDNSEEAFVKYLGEELKRIKNVFVKKKLKQNILNIVYNTDDAPEESETLHSFPIFVSSLNNNLPITALKRENSSEMES